MQEKHDKSPLGSSVYVDAGQGIHVVLVSTVQCQKTRFPEKRVTYVFLSY